jgi:decaprenylphospho-beta-D-erythro-pentofuranosid-2-ulose 2-reductase
MKDAFGHPRTILVLGGSSDIADTTLRQFVDLGLERAVLAVRDVDALTARLESDPLPLDRLQIEKWDATDYDAHEDLVARAHTFLGDIDVVLCTVGSLGHGAGVGTAPGVAGALFADNFGGPASALLAAADHLTGQGHGDIVVLSSIAGLRVRRSNFIYGAAKAGLDAFTQGLADSLVGTGVKVHLVRPGFVETRMTVGLPKAPFSTTTDAVADAIVGSVVAGREATVHVPGLLGPMFQLLRLAPRAVWRRIAGDR